MARKRCQKQAGTAGATKQSGATHSSQENQDDGVTQGASTGEIHENADISATINFDDRPGLPFHEGQTSDQLPEDGDGDKKEGPVGDGDRKDEDASPDSHAHDAHDKNVHSDSDRNNSSYVASSTNGEERRERPELHNHEGQASDQLPKDRGSSPRFVKFSNGPNTNSECSNLLN